jgi:exodeoxyribonuclease VII large subunit
VLALRGSIATRIGTRLVACDPERVAEPEQESLADVPGVPKGEGEGLPGPFPVGRYAKELQGFLRGVTRVQIIGEVTGINTSAKQVYFDLRDADGAIPCTMWRNEWDRLDLPDDAIRDGVEVVAFGGPDYYPGSGAASPKFSFRCRRIRLAGEGDLLARLAELRRKLEGEGLFAPQKQLPRPALPRTIGIVTGRGSAAEADLTAALARRGWAGRALFAHPPVQDRHAAGKIARALTDLAGIPEVEVIVVARGGGSLADLWAFCDETLCRTVAMLRVPVVSAVGHESDRTLIDDVSAVACSTPTHAIEETIRIDVGAARSQLGADAAQIRRAAAEAGASRARRLAFTVRLLGHHTDGQRRLLHQTIREIRAASAKIFDRGGEQTARRALVLARRRQATIHSTATAERSIAGRAATLRRHDRQATTARAAAIERLALTLAAHEPDRVLERGYAIVRGDGGEVVSSAERAREESRLRVRFADDDVLTEVIDDE